MDTIHHVVAGFAPGNTAILVLVSVLVLAVIWQAIARIGHRRHLAKWQRALFYAMAQGLELEVAARPQIQSSPALSIRWRRDVETWITHTGAMLDHHSAQAGICFRFAGEAAVVPVGEFVETSEYERLLVRLRNLRAIIEHPDAYC